MTYAEWLAARTECRAGTLGGARVFVGTRLYVFVVGHLVNSGYGAGTVANEWYPYISVDDARFAERFYQEAVSE